VVTDTAAENSLFSAARGLFSALPVASVVLHPRGRKTSISYPLMEEFAAENRERGTGPRCHLYSYPYQSIKKVDIGNVASLVKKPACMRTLRCYV
jgi:hypothetical protein